MSSHQAAFEAIDALRAADTGATGLNNTLSPAHLFGGMYRRGDPARTTQAPYTEVEIAGEREQDSMGHQHIDLVIRFHIFSKRDTLYTIQAGNQNALAARFRTVYHGTVPATAQGWTFNKMYRTSGVQAPDDGNDAHYVETYLLRMNA